ncbi:MAG: ABC transporter permease, partial [Actinomycetota bacterium]|nr:ABC transporter permease [Actinomycetota bacterium]
AGFFIASLVIGGISQLSFLHPYLFTEHWDAFADLFRVPISWGGIVSDLELQLGWGLVAVLAAWARFTTSDVLA